MIGAMLLLVQLKAVEMGMKVYMPISVLAFTIFISLLGKDMLVNALLEGKAVHEISNSINRIRVSVLIRLGIGMGLLLSIFFF